jgi:hypothetical protein
VKWRAAVARKWGVPVVWEAISEPEPAEAVTVVHVHYWVPAAALPQPRGAFGEVRRLGAGRGE